MLTLRGGGEIRCPVDAGGLRSLPDEVPTGGGARRPAARRRRRSPTAAPPVDLATRPYAPLIAALAARRRPRAAAGARRRRGGIELQPRAPVRSKGARGLMQVMPDTGRQYGVAQPLRSVEQSRRRHAAPQGAAVALRPAAGPGRLQRRRGAPCSRFGGIPPYRRDPGLRPPRAAARRPGRPRGRGGLRPARPARRPLAAHLRPAAATDRPFPVRPAVVVASMRATPSRSAQGAV